MLVLFLFQLFLVLWGNRCHSLHHQQPLQDVLESIEERLDAVVDTLKAFESRFDSRIDEIESKVDDSLKQVERKLDSLHAKVDRVDSKLDRVDLRFNRTETSIQQVSGKLDRAESKRLDVDGKIEALSHDLHGLVESSLEQVSRRVDKWNDNSAAYRRVEVSFQHVSRRMDVIEGKLNPDAIEAKVDASLRLVTRRLDQLDGRLNQLVNLSDQQVGGRMEGTKMVVDLPPEAGFQQLVKKLNSLEVQLNRSRCSESSAQQDLQLVVENLEIQLNRSRCIESSAQQETHLGQMIKKLELYLNKSSQCSSGRVGSEDQLSLQRMSNRLDSFDNKLDLGLNRSEMQVRKTAAAAQELWRVADELRGCSRLRGGGRPSAHGAQVARRLEELGAALESSFASLLVAQNAFIDSCRKDDHIPLLFEMLRSHAQQVGRQVRRHAQRLERLLAPPPPRPTASDDKQSDDYDFEESEPSSAADYEEYQDGYGAENT